MVGAGLPEITVRVRPDIYNRQGKYAPHERVSLEELPGQGFIYRSGRYSRSHAIVSSLPAKQHCRAANALAAGPHRVEQGVREAGPSWGTQSTASQEDFVSRRSGTANGSQSGSGRAGAAGTSQEATNRTRMPPPAGPSRPVPRLAGPQAGSDAAPGVSKKKGKLGASNRSSGEGAAGVSGKPAGSGKRKRREDGGESSKRMFFHSRTCLQMTEEEITADIDSDDEIDEKEIEEEDMRALDDFVDVAPEEKAFMHMWNMFICKHPIYADSYTQSACIVFARHHCAELRQCAIRRCFMLHLVNLWDFGLIDATGLDHCLQIVDSTTETKTTQEGKTSMDGEPALPDDQLAKR
ncbi:hypothetical protein CYMTET_15555 [Cymbomonas tetramitiformis]|uniref:Polycomb protein VEFS-Box domain-containing protein n=1 Tax=Cymbomonas tetramitiformis TaxID=36881 RepID=A0AAE0L8W3_9CHLO|nr:hypothetical protein CYMTET_15555 [Cymbomonas tetramitiformis]